MLINSEVKEVLDLVDKFELEHYYPTDKECILGKAIGEFRTKCDKKSEELLQMEWILLNNSVGNGGITDKWKYILESDRLNKRFPFWRYDSTVINYFTERSGGSLPPITRGRICFYLWNSTNNFEYAIQAMKSFIEAFESHAKSPDFEHGQTAILLGKLINRLLLSLGRPNESLDFLRKLQGIILSITNDDQLRHRLINFTEIALIAYMKLWSRLSDEEKAKANSLVELCVNRSKQCLERQEFHLAIDWVRMIEHFAKSIGNRGLLEQSQNSHLQAILKEAEANKSALIKSSFYGEAISYMRAVGLKDEPMYKQLMTELDKAIKESEKEFKMITTAVEIPLDALDQKIEEVCDAVEGAARLGRLANFLVPSHEEAEAQALIGSGTLANVLPKVVQQNGHVSAPYATGDEKEKYELLNATSLIMQFNETAIKFALEKYQIKKEEFYSIVDDSPITDNSKKLLKHGIGKHFENDFVSSCHVLVQQIEELIRQEARRKGHTSTVFDSRGKAINQQLLGTLIRRPEIISIFSEDFCRAIDAYYANPDFGNLRNLIDHGVVNVNELNEKNSIITMFIIVYILSKMK